MKIETVEVMPEREGNTYKIDWKAFTSDLRHGQILQVTCDPKQDADRLRQAGRASVITHLLPGETVKTRVLGNVVYFQLLNGKVPTTTPQEGASGTKETS